MKQPYLSRTVLISVGVIAILNVAALIEMTYGIEMAVQVAEHKTFARWPDPVVADCGLFPSLVGKKIEFVRLYAYSDGLFHPIPFQIDEKDAKGHYIYPSGHNPTIKDANGVIDEGEELVFMARDCGDRVTPQSLPEGVEQWEELELRDPLTQGKGWVYLLYCSTRPLPSSQEDYIIYIPVATCEGEGDCQIMKSRYMEDHFYPLAPYFDVSKYQRKIGFAHRYMSNPPEAGGTNVNYVDRFKGRITVAFLFGGLKVHFDESSVTFYESAYKDGPLRLIRNLQIIIRLPLGIKAPGIAVDLLWYDTIVDVPVVVDLPFDPKYVLSYVVLQVGEDHGPGAIGMKVYNSNNPLGCTIDGKMDEPAEINWNPARDQWRLMTGPQGTIMNRSFWDENYLKQMKSITVEYIDDLNRPDPPEEHPGMLGMILQTNRVEGIKRARYYSYLEWYWPPRFLFTGPEHTYKVGDEKAYLNIADHPIRLTSGTGSMDSHYFGKMPAYERAEAVIEQQREKGKSGM